MTSDPGLQFRVVDAFADLVEELALAGPLVIGAGRPAVGRPVEPADAGRARPPRLDVPARWPLIGCFRPSPRLAQLERLADSLDAAGRAGT